MNQPKVSESSIFAILAGVIVVLLVCMAGSLFEDADKSKNYVCQMPMSGNKHEYFKTSQIEFVDWKEVSEGNYIASGENPAASLTFNDKGKGFIIGSFRVVMPNDDANMKKIQQDFGSEKAVAVTKAQQEFEVAELEAKKAKQVALKVQAEGEAKAAANRALVSAGLTPAERAEWDYKTAVGVAQALAESKVSWVPSVMFGGSGSSNSAMDAVGLKMLLDITKSFDKTVNNKT